MRPNSTGRNHWVQLAVGAAALLLPPLALGAAFYAMLAEPDEDATRPAVAQAAEPPPSLPIDPPATVGAEPAAVPPPAGKPAEGATRTWEQVPGQGSPIQAGPIQAPIDVAATRTATVNPPADTEGSAAPPAAVAESPPMPVPAPRRHRHAQRPPQQDPYPVRTWLQQIGVLPRNAKD